MAVSRLLAGLLLVLALSVSGCASKTPGGGSGGATLTIRGFAFEPADLRVAAGQTIHVVNRDSALHSVTSNDGGATFDDDVPAGGSVDFTVAQAGTFGFKCKYHSQMSGMLTVS